MNDRDKRGYCMGYRGYDFLSLPDPPSKFEEFAVSLITGNYLLEKFS